MRPHSVLLILSTVGAVIGALLLSGSGDVAAQEGAQALPPHVIDVSPYPGEEVTPEQPVTLTFDQPMERASVEAAWQMTPQAALGFTWAEDGRSVQVLPQGGWQRATRYEITLGTTATALNGLALEEPYSFFVQTIGRLEVSTVVPAPDAKGVAADATITVAFNRPVVPLLSTAQMDQLPAPLTIEPAVEGRGEWVNTSIYQFTPAEPLAGGTLYTVTVQAGLSDPLGATLEASYSWSFRTLPPQILSVSPAQGTENVPLDAHITIRFSQPMDKASTEAAFTLLYAGEPVAGTFGWDEDARELIFTPDELLHIESVYVLTLSAEARSAGGAGKLDAGISYTFTTVPRPGIEETRPANGERDVTPGDGVSIIFRSPMNTETFRDKVEILSPEGVEWQPVASPTRLYLDFPTQPQTEYVIRFKRGAEDVYGNAIETDYTFSFTTGKVDPWAGMPFSGSLMLTNAARPDTAIPLAVQGTPTVSFALYRVLPSQYPDVLYGLPWGDDVKGLLAGAELLREWEQTLKAADTRGLAQVWLASEEGGRLPTGIYIVRAQQKGEDYADYMALGVVSANLTLKRAPDEALVWVSDLQSGAPLSDVSVQFYRNREVSPFASARTDANGLVRQALPRSERHRSDYVVAQGEGVFGVWTSWGGGDPPEQSIYLYTDRPIYRPGETVYVRGVVRDKHDTTYVVPDTSAVHVTMEDPQGQPLLEKDVPLTEFGTFSVQVDLPEDAPIGYGQIGVDYRGGYGGNLSFQVAEFRVPEYKVQVTPERDEMTQGDPLRAIVAASYYFGGPVSDAEMQWNAWGNAAYFNYTGPGRYTFVDDEQDYFSDVYLGGEDVRTDAEGKVLAALETVQAPSICPMQLTIEGTVSDESGQVISGRATVMAHPADVYVGLHTERYFGQAEKPMTVDLIAVTPQSEPLAEQKIALSVLEVRWERVPLEGQFGQYDWERREIEIETGEVVTGADGTAQYTFTPPRAGIYRVRAQTRDLRERLNVSAIQVWVMGSTPVWWGRPSDTVDLIADKDSYKPGETAEVLIPVPFSGTSYALVTTERESIMHVEVLRVEGSSLLYKLPITDEHVPTVYLSVVLVKGVDAETPNPVYRTGTIDLSVEPIEQALHVLVTPSATRAQPGQTVTLDVQTLDAHDEPVQAEVGVTVTDQAILSLASPNSAPILEHFYGGAAHYVNTDVALSALIDAMTDEALVQTKMRQEAVYADGMAPMAPMATTEGELGMGGGEPGVATVQVREEFLQTPLWAPHVVTDANGRASVTVTLPDNLTTWQVDARGLTQDTRVGQTEAEVVVALPLMVRPVVPRFFVVEDRAVLAAVINNNTETAQTVQATLEADGVSFLSDPTQTVTVEAGARVRVEWEVTVQDVPYVDMTFYAIGENGYQDAAKPSLATGPNGTIPVYRYTAPDTVGTGGMLRESGSRTEAISLPPRLDFDQGALIVKLDPSLAVTTVDALDYLKNYPHQCIEQTVSRFLPNVVTYRALKELGIDDAELRAELEKVLNEALDRLRREQNTDGGWGWFGNMRSNPYITAYAALGLTEARDAGFEVDAEMLEAALNFVRSNLIVPNIDTPTYTLNRQAFYAYVLARAGALDKATLDMLLGYRLEMHLWARSFLLMAYLELDPSDAAVPQLVSDLQSAAILSATGTHWEDGSPDWWNWSSDTRTTALVLAALTRAQPELEILPGAVRWLMVARQGDHWVTTQETVWAVLALTDWMRASGELQGAYSYALALNGDALAEGEVTPATVREGQELRVAVGELLRDEVNRLTVIRGEGPGALYYSAHLDLRLPAAEAKPISRGITVSREFFRSDDLNTPITEATVGDEITVRVTITLPQDVYYFVLEDPIPAGTEPIDTSLLTTSQATEPPTLELSHSPRWYWGWWFFDRSEMRDEQVNLYADFLPAGTYVYSYKVRASFPGQYQTMPSHAYAFYFPEVFGRGAGVLFTVNDAE